MKCIGDYMKWLETFNPVLDHANEYLDNLDHNQNIFASITRCINPYGVYHQWGNLVCKANIDKGSYICSSFADPVVTMIRKFKLAKQQAIKIGIPVGWVTEERCSKYG
jgi:hypothetical protein